MDANHTPTPWKAMPQGEKSDEPTVCYCGDWRIVVDGGRRYDDHAEDGDDAAFIVKAANSHDALVAALQGARKALMHYEWFSNPKSGWASEESKSLRDDIDAALKATGG